MVVSEPVQAIALVEFSPNSKRVILLGETIYVDGSLKFRGVNSLPRFEGSQRFMGLQRARRTATSIGDHIIIFGALRL